jgi:hypothetical protein
MSLNYLWINKSKEDRSIPECEFYIGDALSGTFNDCAYRHAGSGSDIFEK